MKPLDVRACQSVPCTATTNSAVRLVIRLRVETDSIEGLLSALAASARVAIAEVLSVPYTGVEVAVVQDGDSVAAPLSGQRRLLAHVSRLDVSVRGASRGALARLEFTSGNLLLAEHLRKELVAHGVAVGDCLVHTERVSEPTVTVLVGAGAEDLLSTTSFGPSVAVDQAASNDSRVQGDERMRSKTTDALRSIAGVEAPADGASGAVIAVVVVLTCLLGAIVSGVLLARRFKWTVPRSGLVAHFHNEATSEDEAEQPSSDRPEGEATPQGKAVISDGFSALRVAAHPSESESALGSRIPETLTSSSEGVLMGPPPSLPAGYPPSASSSLLESPAQGEGLPGSVLLGDSPSVEKAVVQCPGHAPPEANLDSFPQASLPRTTLPAPPGPPATRLGTPTLPRCAGESSRASTPSVFSATPRAGVTTPVSHAASSDGSIRSEEGVSLRTAAAASEESRVQVQPVVRDVS